MRALGWGLLDPLSLHMGPILCSGKEKPELCGAAPGPGKEKPKLCAVGAEGGKEKPEL